jgi:hypothetical protein
MSKPRECSAATMSAFAILIAMLRRLRFFAPGPIRRHSQANPRSRQGSQGFGLVCHATYDATPSRSVRRSESAWLPGRRRPRVDDGRTHQHATAHLSPPARRSYGSPMQARALLTASGRGPYCRRHLDPTAGTGIAANTAALLAQTYRRQPSTGLGVTGNPARTAIPFRPRQSSAGRRTCAQVPTFAALVTLTGSSGNGSDNRIRGRVGWTLCGQCRGNRETGGQEEK